MALKSLRNKKHIVFKPSDKGSGMILMNEDYYRQKISSMLTDESTYKPLGKNIDRTTINKIKDFIKNTNNGITRKEKEFILKFDVKTSQFYGLPKIH